MIFTLSSVNYLAEDKKSKADSIWYKVYGSAPGTEKNKRRISPLR